MNQEQPIQEGPRPHRAQQYRFSPDELRVLKECNKESFYQRCLPLGAVFGFTTYAGVKAGYLRAHQRLGATPKVGIAIVVGYFLGKFSYQTKCAEKLMQLPNSQFGEMLRKRRQGTLTESLEPGFGPGMSLSPFSGISQSETYSDHGPRSVDIDISRPQLDGLDDSHRPSVDNPIYEEEMPPMQKHTTSYDDLRKQNRDEFQQKRTLNYRETARPQPPPPAARPSQPTSTAPRNQYGDVIE